MEVCVICTSGLSGAGAIADEGERTTCCGSVPQPASRAPRSASAAGPACRNHRQRLARDRMRASISTEVGMQRCLAFALLLFCVPGPAGAALDIGDPAPDFTTPAALGGKVYQFSLGEALKKGPVVLY